ncbi:MAG TPA: ABC transporter ATP-binding protein, partial [Acidimicrobiales bacterium]|nr:ABC transporter ATP-binding protein [Acidimicrobiales bacterium]
MASYSSPTTDVPGPDRDRTSQPEGEVESRRPAGAGTDATPMVEAHGLTKRFGEFVAVDGVDFTIAAGESFGFLGPNGAGKTSTMRMIACISPVSAGTLRVLGQDPTTDGSRIRARMGVVPQEDSLDLDLTVMDNLMIYGR